MGQKHSFLQNEPEKLLKTKALNFKMGQNEPENEPEKPFRISRREKTNRNEQKNEACYLIENTQSPKTEGRLTLRFVALRASRQRG
jgi:hypothetical protein